MRHRAGDSPAKTASAQSVRHAINAISIRIALHSQASVVAITLAGNLFSNSREREREREREFAIAAIVTPPFIGEELRFRRRVQNKRRRFAGTSSRVRNPFLPSLPPPPWVFIVSFALSFSFHPLRPSPRFYFLLRSSFRLLGTTYLLSTCS